MNLSVYLFGSFSGGYTQYPNDYTQSIFKTFYENSKAKTQIAIHRDGDLMYYGYIRKLEQDSYIGICTVINGAAVTKVTKLIEAYEQVIELMVKNGYLIHYNNAGEIVSKVSQIYKNEEAIELITQSVRYLFDDLATIGLPPVNFSTSRDSVKNYTVQDNEAEIVKSSYTYGYTFVYKSSGYDTSEMYSYKNVLQNCNNENRSLKQEIQKYKKEISSLKNKQRNFKWVAVLGAAVLVLFFILYVKVINPNEVTKKDMGEYVYYGPMKKGEPNGVGVAIYHEHDRDGRLYYYGNFENGRRIDTNAIMFYRDGSYFKGSMYEDQWQKGLFFDVEKSHFIGEFENNTPWNGEWYSHVKVQTIVEGNSVKK
jgi:hypothetical protein